MSEKAAAPEKAEKAKGSKSTMLIVVAVVLLGGGGGGYYWYAKKAAAAALAAAAEDEESGKADSKEEKGEHSEKSTKKKKKKKKGEEEARLMSFEPFVVNLADQGSARFLRTNVQLVVTGGEKAGGEGEGKKGPSVEQMRARSAILELLSAETSDKLTTPEGKEELKKRIIDRMEDILAKSETDVEDVLFSDFVIQF